MKRLSPAIFLLAFIVFVSGCKNSNGGSSVYKEQSSEVQQALDTWKSDPIGCMKKRTAPIANQLVAAFTKAGLSEEQLVDLLGEAEYRYEKGEALILTWYFDASCEDGKMKKGSVYCTLQFFMDVPTGKTEYAAVTCG